MKLQIIKALKYAVIVYGIMFVLDYALFGDLFSGNFILYAFGIAIGHVVGQREALNDR